MALAPSREAFITCALTGAGDTTGRSDKVPVTPEQIARAGIDAARAGAAIIRPVDSLTATVGWRATGMQDSAPSRGESGTP